MAVTGSADACRAPPLCEAHLDPHVLAADYAVRGEIVRRAQVIERELAEHQAPASSEASSGGAPGQRYPFNRVVWCNIGNPQILGQAPITYFRQVLALCEYPVVRRLRGCLGWMCGGSQKG